MRRALEHLPVERDVQEREAHSRGADPPMDLTPLSSGEAPEHDSRPSLPRTPAGAPAKASPAAARALLVKGVPEATVKKSITTVEDEGFHLVGVGVPTADGQHVAVTVELTDKDGKAVTRQLEFRSEGDEWVVYSPHLKPL